MSIETSTLKKSTRSALKWNFTGVAVSSSSSLLIGVILARLLGPKPFGQVAIAMLIIGAGNLFSDFGFSAAIVQRDSLSEEDIRFVFTFQMLSGVILASACFLGAGVIASLFHSKEVMPVIRALSLIFPLQAFGQTASNLLKRRLKFRAIQIVQIGSYIAYVVVGIPLAVFGFGVWALVIAQLVQVSLNSAMAYSMVLHSLLFCFRPNRSILGFGVKVIGTNVANWSISNLDNGFVGRVFGVVALGLYSRAFQLASAPMNAVVSGFQSVLFAAYSRAQNRGDALRKVYLMSIAIMAVALVPMFMTAAAVPFTIILALYGHAWVGAVPLFVPLALAMPLNALLALAGPLLWGIGKVEKELKVQFVTALMAVVVFAVTSRASVVCLAWGVLAVYAFRFFGMTREMVRYLKITWHDIGLALRGGTAIGLLTAALVWIFNGLMVRFGLPAMFRLVADIVVALSITTVSLATIPNIVLGPYADFLLLQIRLMMPVSMSRFMPRTRMAES